MTHSHSGDVINLYFIGLWAGPAAQHTHTFCCSWAESEARRLVQSYILQRLDYNRSLSMANGWICNAIGNGTWLFSRCTRTVHSVFGWYWPVWGHCAGRHPISQVTLRQRAWVQFDRGHPASSRSPEPITRLENEYTQCTSHSVSISHSTKLTGCNAAPWLPLHLDERRNWVKTDTTHGCGATTAHNQKGHHTVRHAVQPHSCNVCNWTNHFKNV